MHDDELTRHGKPLWESFKREVLEDRDLVYRLEKFGIEFDRSAIRLPFAEPSLGDILQKDIKSICQYYFNETDFDQTLDVNALNGIVLDYEVKVFNFIGQFRNESRIAEGQINPLTPDLKREVIRPGWWVKGAYVNFKANTFVEEVPIYRRRRNSRFEKPRPPPRDPVKFTDIKIWEGEEWRQIIARGRARHEATQQHKNVGGRPPEYDWDEMWIEVVRRALKQGLPKKQNTLVKDLLEWSGLTWGTEPGDSTVRKRISKLYKALSK